MKFVLPLLFTLFTPVVTVLPAFSQAPARPTVPSSVGPVAPRLQGEISYKSGETTRTVSLRWQAPDNVRIEDAAQTLIGSGDSTLVYDATTRRVQRLPFNIAREPWRAGDLISGGPANVAIFGLKREWYETAYRTVPAAAGSLAWQARPETAPRARDVVRTGEAKNTLFYAASSALVYEIPETFRLAFQNGALANREETRIASVISAAITADATTKLPLTAKTADAEWVYSLKPADADFAPETWKLAAAANDAIIEDARLRALDKSNGNDASAVLARGRIYAVHLEDLRRAQQLFDEAATLAPRATAPHFLAYDAALLQRDLPQAQKSLGKLTALLGADSPAVATRRAQLAAMRRDWATALTSLQTQKNTNALLTTANLLRAQGNTAGARATWLELLKDNGTSPDAHISAARGLAETTLSPEESTVLRAALPATAAGNFAAGLLDLRAGRTPAEYSRFRPYLTALTWEAARAGRLDDAQKLAVDSGDAAAQWLVGAARGDASSLKAFRDALAVMPTEAAKANARAALFDAWRKAFRQNELKSALENRALAGAANDDDLRTLLAWQELNGSDEEIAATIRAAATRFPKSAWWHSRLAEQLNVEREALDWKQSAARAALLREAQEEITRAMELDENQIYYAMQNALLQVQIASKPELIIDVKASQANRARAEAALAALETRYTDNADAAILAALGRNALVARPTDATIGAMERALAVGAPEGDRHGTVFFMRQAIAMQWRKLGRNAEAAHQYELLMDAARAPDEVTGIALNYLLMLQEIYAPAPAAPAEVTPADDEADETPEGAAAPTAREISPQMLEAQAVIVERLAREPWPLSVQNASMSQVISVLLRDRAVVIPFASYLSQGNAVRKLVAAQLQFEAERIFTVAASVPDAPPAAERNLREVQNAAQVAVDALNEIARGEDKLVAARALVLLAEREANFQNPTEAARLLRLAIAFEPFEAGLRVALADALQSAKKTDEAIAARDALLRDLPRTAANLRLAASLSLRLNQGERAAGLALEAQREAALSPQNLPADVETTSFILARSLWASGKSTEAEAIYKKLADPQWGIADRAAAYIDWIDSLRSTDRSAEADRLQAQLDALEASETEMLDANALLQSL
ncbi:MAG TPA: hypothetical protein VF681_12975 [Abditibacteriaceae bacterium]|jgi:hypothetical protein